MIAAIALATCLGMVDGSTSSNRPAVILEYTDSITDTFTGPVYVAFTRSSRRPPSTSMNWFAPEPLYRIDVVNWNPGEPLELDSDATGFPAMLGELDDGAWRLQAIMRMDPDLSSLAEGHAALSEIITVNNGQADAWPARLTIDQLQERRPPYQPEGAEFLSHRSELLSTFHGRDITMRAMAFFPKAFDPEADRNWPVLYVIGGFPGAIREAGMSQMMWGDPDRDQELVIIYIEGECGSGHHVFADSENNGPRGQALVEEFIPWLESTYPLIPGPEGRLLTGHSSGGWSSLWLQITYPEVFGGTWSTAPDPVDFHAFQMIDIYAEEANAYRAPDGSRTAVARGRDGQPALYMDDFCAMEEAIGDGGQIRSFEWVFSPRGLDGRPRPLFDRTNGEIDPEVAEAWKAYDIARVLKENWKTLGPKLKGKIHVYMGEQDTFYLDEATRRLREQMKELDSDAVIEMMPGDHSSILFGDLRQRIIDDMSQTVNADDQAMEESAGSSAD